MPRFRKRRAWWAILLLSLLFLPPFLSPALAKSWSIPRAEIALTLERDGSLRVVERRTFRFSGPFTHAYQEIRYPVRSQLTDIQVTGPEGIYRQAEGKSPGTFTWDGSRLDWYFDLADTDATFTVAYRISNAIRMHADGAELFWQVIGDGWKEGTGRAEVMVDLPEEPVDAWVEDGAGDLTVAGRTVRITRERLGPETPLTVRILVPKTAVTGSTLPSDGQTLDAVRKRAWRITDPSSVAWHVAWTAGLLLAAFWFYRLHVRRPRFHAPGPQQELPAPLVALLTGQSPETGLRAAVLELALTGVIVVTQESENDWRFTRVESATVPPHAQGALAVLLPPRAELDHPEGVASDPWQGACHLPAPDGMVVNPAQADGPGVVPAAPLVGLPGGGHGDSPARPYLSGSQHVPSHWRRAAPHDPLGGAAALLR